MTDPRITCPHCSADIPLTESLAGPMLAATRREAAERQAAALIEQKRAIEGRAAESARAAQAEAIAEMAEAGAAREAELAALKARDGAREAKLAAAQKAQADAMAREAALAEREREMELDIRRQVGAATEAARLKLTAQAEALAGERVRVAQEAASLKLVEKDQQMDGLRRQIEVLTRKVEQGSQQLQGEAAEVLLEDQLGAAFPVDSIAPVGKGARGADCLQEVRSATGVAGSILWESKRTANWSPGWLPKLKEDMRAAGADMAVLTSQARPEGVDSFRLIEGVWVAAPRHAVALAAVLREALLAAAVARGQREGQASKTEMLYDYLMGPQFRARVEAMAERMDEMRAGLAQERKLMQRHWAAREKQIETAFGAMVGIYGDIQGIGGTAMQQIEALEPTMIEEE